MERNGASLDPRQEFGIDKTLLATRVAREYPELEEILGYERASYEMGLRLGEYVLRGELNQFEADMIATLAILGHVATHALNEMERLRGGNA